MDDRELRTWYKAARAQKLEGRMHAMDAARSAWLESEDFGSAVQEMVQEIRMLRGEVKYSQVVNENWDGLREAGGG